MFRLFRHSFKQIRTILEFPSKLNRGIAPIIFCIHFQRAVLEYDIIQRRKILVGKLRMADKVLNSRSVFCVQLIYIYAGIYQYLCQFHCLLHNVLRARKQNVEQCFAFFVCALQFCTFANQKLHDVIPVLGCLIRHSAEYDGRAVLGCFIQKSLVIDFLELRQRLRSCGKVHIHTVHPLWRFIFIQYLIECLVPKRPNGFFNGAPIHICFQIHAVLNKKL